MPGGPKNHTILRTEEDISPMNRQLINHVCHKCNFYGENQELFQTKTFNNTGKQHESCFFRHFTKRLY